MCLRHYSGRGDSPRRRGPAPRGTRPRVVARQIGFPCLLFLGILLPACARPLPVPPPVISGYGDWTGGTGLRRSWQHYGIDIRAPVGTPVLAAADGTVLRVTEGPISGKMIILAHSEDLATSYHHLSEISTQEGEWIQRGTAIGRSGMTGNATTPHLHFGVCRVRGGRCGNRLDQGWDDPARYWVPGDRCFQSGEVFPPMRLTYPLPCQTG